MNNLKEIKEELIKNINQRVEDKIIEKTNADLLTKLINNAETIEEANNIAILGTIYKKTGFHFDPRLEKIDNTINYFKKNEELSFITDKNAKTHKLIIGDNYKALLNLLIEYKNKIDVIYIDPPYGKDSMGEFAKTNYNNNITRDNLLSMLYPRLLIAKKLLTDDGVIFCSIDDKNQAYVKLLFDEVFGERNNICMFNWQTKKAAQGMNTENLVVSNDEYILCYGKNKNNFKFLGLNRDEENFSNPDNDPRGLYKRQYLQRLGQNLPIRTIKNPKNNMIFSFETPYSQEKLEDWIKDNRIIFPETNDKYPARKEFLNEYEQKQQLTTNLGLYSTKATTEKLYKLFNDVKIFTNPKPNTLIKFLIKQSTTNINQNYIILDFFAGSGTTGQAVLELNKEDNGNRKFILCQLDEDLDKAFEETNNETVKNQIEFCEEFKRPHKLSEIIAERLRRVMTGKDFKGNSNFELITQILLGDNLDVYNIEKISNIDNTKSQTPFDLIDETLYGKEKFKTVKEKIEWVCENFEGTQKYLE